MNSHAKSDDRAEQRRRSEVVGRVWQWANDPTNHTPPTPEEMLVVLSECQRLADNTARYERMRVALAQAEADIAAYQAEQKRLRDQLNGVVPQPAPSLLTGWEGNQ